VEALAAAAGASVLYSLDWRLELDLLEVSLMWLIESEETRADEENNLELRGTA